MLHTTLIGADEPVRSTQTSQQYSQLEAVIAENEKLAAELNERFRAVLRNENSATADVKSAPEEMLVPLADGLRSIAKVAIRTNYALRSILERAEI